MLFNGDAFLGGLRQDRQDWVVVDALEIQHEPRDITLIAKHITEYYRKDETEFPPADPDEMTHVLKKSEDAASPSEDQELSATD